MAAELVDTGRLYARTVARIDPRWVETAAGSASGAATAGASRPTGFKSSGGTGTAASGVRAIIGAGEAGGAADWAGSGLTLARSTSGASSPAIGCVVAGW